MTVEQVHEHVSAIDLDTLKPLEIDDDLGQIKILEKICEIYQKVRPILEFLSTFFIIPKKWKAVILAFMATMDQLCPQG
jgi:hypothetical protein